MARSIVTLLVNNLNRLRSQSQRRLKVVVGHHRYYFELAASKHALLPLDFRAEFAAVGIPSVARASSAILRRLRCDLN